MYPALTNFSATCTLISLTTAIAVIVEPGPTGVCMPGIATNASPTGTIKSITKSALSESVVPEE